MGSLGRVGFKSGGLWGNIERAMHEDRGDGIVDGAWRRRRGAGLRLVRVVGPSGRWGRWRWRRGRRRRGRRRIWDFFWHGSMSTEFAPEAVLRAFIKVYPDLFPSGDFSHLGAIADPEFGVAGGVQPGEGGTLGVGCRRWGDQLCFVSCGGRWRWGRVREGGPARERVRVLGVTSLFNVEGIFLGR